MAQQLQAQVKAALTNLGQTSSSQDDSDDSMDAAAEEAETEASFLE